LRDFVCYSDAEKLENKISEQKLGNDYVVSKIKKIEGYHGSYYLGGKYFFTVDEVVLNKIL
jgi:hypothetical protein